MADDVADAVADAVADDVAVAGSEALELKNTFENINYTIKRWHFANPVLKSGRYFIFPHIFFKTD